MFDLNISSAVNNRPMQLDKTAVPYIRFFRVSQMYCMAKYMARSSQSDAIIAVGDFNSKEDEIATKLFIETSGLTDRYSNMFIFSLWK